jgi:hypothetical protein
VTPPDDQGDCNLLYVQTSTSTPIGHERQQRRDAMEAECSKSMLLSQTSTKCSALLLEEQATTCCRILSAGLTTSLFLLALPSPPDPDEAAIDVSFVEVDFFFQRCLSLIRFALAIHSPDQSNNARAASVMVGVVHNRTTLAYVNKLEDSFNQ